MHINTVNVNGIYVSYNIENVKSKTQNGKIEEQVQATATFQKNGNIIKKIYNLNNLYFSKFEYCTKLLNDDFAKKEAIQMIETENKSKHSPFLES